MRTFSMRTCLPKRSCVLASPFARTWACSCLSFPGSGRPITEHGRDFVADLDKFLGALPKGWPYGIEMRNRAWLRLEYFECLARHQVTHVFNSWEAMPAVSEQMALPGSRTNPDLVAARFLLKPGRQYEEAVKAFEPYDSIKEENPGARAAGRALIEAGV